MPKYWNGTKPDLLVSGPNFGTNLGPYLYTLSGTIGTTHVAVERSPPAIAFSGGNGRQRSQEEVNKTNLLRLPQSRHRRRPALRRSRKPTRQNREQISQLLLPLGYGLSVNYPELTSLENADCVAPPFIPTRMTGGAEVDTAVF